MEARQKRIPLPIPFSLIFYVPFFPVSGFLLCLLPGSEGSGIFPGGGYAHEGLDVMWTVGIPV